MSRSDDDDRFSDRPGERRRDTRRDDDRDDDRDYDRGDDRRYGGDPYDSVRRRDIPNYLVQSILVTLFCCLPFGIAAIVNAAKVNNLLSQGDYRGAQEASDKAKQWCWVSFGLGLAVIAVRVLILVAQSANEFK